jgi:uncharacterized protein (TIGR03503 family)
LEIRKKTNLTKTNLFNTFLIKISLTIVTAFGLSIPYSLSASQDDRKLDRTEIEYYQNDNKTNQIPYFDNRFRIDSELDEITLIFYRKSGSKPIILIRPDGSKIRVNGFDREKIQWYDDSTFDMIKIKKPMPGPWQAVGDILPNSQILIVSDIKINVDPLPDTAFSGETLKIEGKLFNGADEIDTPHFKDVVKLDVNFYSTNNSSYDNFGADAIKITSFRDDGRGLDEYANDSLFTGEFVLDFAAGEWQPVYLVKLPMATRELRQKPILLLKTPFTVNVETSEFADSPHKMTIEIDPSFVDVNSFVFQGKITFPDRQVEPFSIMEEEGSIRIENIDNTEAGIYRINISAFGKTIKGREFRLVAPEISFLVKSDDNPILDNIDMKNNLETPLDKEEQDKADVLVNQQQAEEDKSTETMIIIAVGNGVIIVVALALFLFLNKRKKNKGRLKASNKKKDK